VIPGELLVGWRYIAVTLTEKLAEPSAEKLGELLGTDWPEKRKRGRES